MTILITGVAGFIGSAVAEYLLQQEERVYGIDNLNDYYDVNLKRARLNRLQSFPEFSFDKIDIVDRDEVEKLFSDESFATVFHAAAQANVRYSLKNPSAYIETNLVGFWNILHSCMTAKVKHLIFASSSSVYGANKEAPSSESHRVDHPVSLYAATKRADELLAYSYAHLFRLPCTGIRFFTVYGPWGRPDMALFSFANSMLKGQAIDVFNYGEIRRDFTYIDDAIAGVVGLIGHIPQSDDGDAGGNISPVAKTPYKIYNIGSNQPQQLMDLITYLENELGIKAIKNMLPMQIGDVPSTFADTTDIARDIGFKATVSLREGVRRFVRWYKGYLSELN